VRVLGFLFVVIAVTRMCVPAQLEGTSWACLSAFGRSSSTCISESGKRFDGDNNREIAIRERNDVKLVCRGFYSLGWATLSNLVIRREFLGKFSICL
jgi:hypothetical protein